MTHRQDQKGAYATFKIQAKTFIQTGIAFSPSVVQGLVEAGEGTQVSVGGTLARRAVAGEGGISRAVSSYRAVVVRVSDPMAAVTETAAETAAVTEEEVPGPADDLTLLKGVGAKAAETPEGIIHLSQIAALDDSALVDLDARVSAVSGTLLRGDIRAQARTLAEFGSIVREDACTFT